MDKKIVTIHFEDNGQDFLVWDVDLTTNKVVRCEPFQESIWCESHVNVRQREFRVGGHVKIESHYVGNMPIMHCIEAIEYDGKNYLDLNLGDDFQPLNSCIIITELASPNGSATAH